MKVLDRLAICVVAASLLSACAVMTSPKVHKARASYVSAMADPGLVKAAPSALNEAESSLNRADDALKHRHKQQADHYAYMASRQIQLARLRSQQMQLKTQLDAARRKKQGLKLQLRQQQVSQVHQSAVQAQEQAQQFTATLRAIGARRTSRGIVVVLDGDLFASGKSQLKLAGSAMQLESLAKFLHKHATRRLVVEGYTDNSGAKAKNQKLSEDRSLAVKSALIGRGIDPRRIKSVGLGARYPRADNDTAAGRAQNRRVEIVISNSQGHFKDPRVSQGVQQTNEAAAQ